MPNRTYGDKLTVIANQTTAERDYWLHQLSGAPEKSNFPFDFFKENITESRLETVKFRFYGELFAKLMKLSNHSDVKLNMILVAGLETLLSKYTGRNDIMIGTPIYQQQMEGDFINTVLVLRNWLEDSMTFKQLLLQVRKTLNEATENQNYPIELLAEPLKMPVLGDAFPFFDIIILLHNIHYKKYIQGIHFHMLFAFNRTDQYIEAELEYNASLYRERTIEQIITHYTCLMEKILQDVDVELSCVDILSEQERHQVLVEFNANEMDFPKGKTFPQLFQEQVERTGDKIAVIGMGHGSWVMASITYHKLNEKSNQLAWILREKGVKPDTIVGILVDRSLEMIIGLLGILKSGGAYLPLDPTYPKERINFMLKDSNAGVLLKSEFRSTKSDATLRSRSLRSTRTNPNDQNSNDETWGVTSIVLNFEHLNFEFVSNFEFRVSNLSSSNLAYVIYTSGSTGRPKGVMVEHKQMAAYLKAFEQQFTITPGDVVIQQASYAFDAFVEEVYPILTKGARVAIPLKSQVIDIVLLADFIAKHNVTIIDCSPLLLNELNKRSAVKPFPSIHTYISGGDVLKGSYIDRLVKHGTVFNTYGPTETTVCATYYRCMKCESSLIPIGKPIANYGVYILGKNNQLQPIGIVGELVVAGVGITRGYLNKAELTAEKYDQDICDYLTKRFLGGPGGRFFKKAPLAAGGRIYKTGDLGRWMPDGNIEFLGRIDLQVKIRGFRIELGEIEAQLLKHKDIEEAVVVSRIDETSGRYLIAYIVTPERIPDAKELREYLSCTLPDYMIPSYFIQLDQMPLTSSGKINRKGLSLEAGKAIAIGAVYTPPTNETEKELEKIWQEILNAAKIGIDDNFFELGGDSLKAMALVSRVHKVFNQQLSLVSIFQSPTIREMAKSTVDTDDKSSQTIYSDIGPVEKKEYYNLSSSQKRLFVLDQMEGMNTTYHISNGVLIEGIIDKERIEEVTQSLTQRHESFRTSFHMGDQHPVQKIHQHVEFKIEYDEVPNAHTSSRQVLPLISQFIRPFDLSQAPLLRIGFIKIADKKHIFTVDMHHIISDGVSMVIVVNEFMALYREETLPELRLQYKEFSQWHNHWLLSGEIKKQEDYWLNEFKGEIPVLNLPIDYERPEIQSFEGSYLDFDLGQEGTRRLREFAKAENVTMFILLFAVYNVFLHKLSGQEDIVVGTVTAGRRHVNLGQVIGMFVNTLALRSCPEPNKKFIEFLKDVKEKTLHSFDNQDYQLDDLVEKLLPNRDTSRNPLFDVVFAFASQEMLIASASNPGLGESDLKIRSYEYEVNESKFDLILGANDFGKRIEFIFQYSTKLFNESTIERFIDYFKEIVFSVLENKFIQIKDITISYDLEVLKSDLYKSAKSNFEF